MEKSDFAIYQKGGDILSMGFKFENLLKDKGLPAMIGGGKGKFHKNQYGIPVGLALLNRQLGKKKTYHRNFEGGVVKEELYRKLLFMGEQRKTSNSKTRRKQKKKKKRRKTRKLK